MPKLIPQSIISFRSWLLLLAFLVAGCGGSGGDSASSGGSSGNQPKSFQSWVQDLPSSGYNVSQGSSFLLTDEQCALFDQVFGSCFANNPAAPYLIPQPPNGNAYMDPYYTSQFAGTGPTGDTTNVFYRLSDNDALVTLLQLPPRAAYLGYVSYVFTSATDNYSNSLPTQVVSPDPARFEIFGSLGNTTNNVIINNQSGAAWNGQTVVLVTTSNQSLGNALIANAKANGLDTNFIFTEPVGSNVITGYSSTADDLITLIRYALPENSDAGGAWLNNPATAGVYRVSNSTIPVTRFGAPVYSSKVGLDESQLRASTNELAGLLTTWLTSVSPGQVVQSQRMTVSDHVDAEGEPFGLVGSDCIATGTICAGDNQDTDAYRFSILSGLSDAQEAILVGVNHAVTNNASYISLGVYNSADFTGVADTSQTNPAVVGFDSGNLTGSAAAVLQELGLYDMASPSLQADLPSLFVTFVSRSCPYAPTYCINLEGTTLLPETVPVGIIMRSYLKPGGTNGANPDIMVNTHVITTSTFETGNLH